MNPAVVHKHNISFYIPQYKRWRGETFLFKLTSYLSCLGFYSSACKQKQIVFNRKNLNPFNPCKTDNFALEYVQVPYVWIPLITWIFVDYDNSCI